MIPTRILVKCKTLIKPDQGFETLIGDEAQSLNPVKFCLWLSAVGIKTVKCLEIALNPINNLYIRISWS